MSDERDELRDLVERLGVEWLAADRESDREFGPTDAREHYWAQLREVSRRIVAPHSSAWRGGVTHSKPRCLILPNP